jgi:putative GTP pyrophosphokinase
MIHLTDKEQSIIDPLVQRYVRNRSVFDHIAKLLFSTIEEAEELRPLIHSVKYRSKDPGHLADKLVLKLRKCEEAGTRFDITPANLFRKVNDLAGIRILHLHTSQIADINPCLQSCLAAKNFLRIEGPVAKTWDDEYRRFFEKMSFETEASKNQYTRVHYVFDTQNDLEMTIEVQVRTLAEELWGEVDHQLNYPEKHESLECKEQIAVLARVTSSCTRLVDSIFRSDIEHQRRKLNTKATKRKKRHDPAV